MDSKIKDSHALKSESYDIGRPIYPKAFYEFLYNEVGFEQNSVIADVGAGTGKVTRGFLDYGSKVYAIEPDNDMLKILKDKIGHYTNCIPLANTAENTCIESNIIDFIFCGNSYHWFERSKVIPEFKRI